MVGRRQFRDVSRHRGGTAAVGQWFSQRDHRLVFSPFPLTSRRSADGLTIASCCLAVNTFQLRNVIVDSESGKQQSSPEAPRKGEIALVAIEEVFADA